MLPGRGTGSVSGLGGPTICASATQPCGCGGEQTQVPCALITSQDAWACGRGWLTQIQRWKLQPRGSHLEVSRPPQGEPGRSCDRLWQYVRDPDVCSAQPSSAAWTWFIPRGQRRLEIQAAA